MGLVSAGSALVQPATFSTLLARLSEMIHLGVISVLVTFLPKASYQLGEKAHRDVK